VAAFPAHTDAAWQSLLAAAGFRRTGVFMRMPAAAVATGIRFEPLGPSALEAYLAAHADLQAASLAAHRGGPLTVWRERIAADLAERFRSGSCPGPEGIRTVIDGDVGDEVGVIWTSDHDEGGRRSVFIEEFAIHPHCRRKGFARRALLAIGDPRSGLSGDILSLFVQPENQPAWALY
jgi:ribosomal protein S18 acetylase RimI-like enzyme